jgi:hypothetical protein
MASRLERIAENVAAFRAVNERISEWPEHQQTGPDEPLAFVCECGRRDCFERVYLTRAQYEAVRRDAALFAVTPGHEIPDVEQVVDQHPGYLVVRKNEDVRSIVEGTDPRQSDP